MAWMFWRPAGLAGLRRGGLMVLILAGEGGGLIRPTAWKAGLVLLLLEVVEVDEEEEEEELLYGENLAVFILSRPGLPELRLA